MGTSLDYASAMAFWHGRIDYERRQPRPGDLALDRMRSLLRRLGDPHRRIRCVHVAGTKGKGSTSAMLASVMRSAGYRTGLFTSPHLVDISERIQVDGVPISHDELAARMSEVVGVVKEMDADGDPNRSPTFFEIITALGFLHFDCRRVDVAVLEVGLGGRFDSTNVCEPLVSIITNISLDHTAILGYSIREIAFQKAGIIKRGIPVVSTAEDAEAQAVIADEAADHGALCQLIDRDFQVTYHAVTAETGWPTAVIACNGRTDDFSIPLLGAHQARNASGVVATVGILRRIGMPIPQRAVHEGLRNVVWPGRMELVGRRPTVVIDCAHNLASIRAVMQTFRESFPVAGRRLLVFAASTDKAISEMIAELADGFDEIHLTRYLSNPRSADPQGIALLVPPRSALTVQIHADPSAAWAAVRGRCGPDDAVLICGSVFLAGEMRAIIVPT